VNIGDTLLGPGRGCGRRPACPVKLTTFLQTARPMAEGRVGKRGKPGVV
jgi:hypothetical protein